MKTEEPAKSWRKYGVVVIPEFLDQWEVDALRRICDRVLEQALAQDSRLANARNIAYLTERKYFRSDDAELLKLLEFIADGRILSLLTTLAGELPLFHNTQYFYNPTSRSHDGEWHRDTQFLAPDPGLEKVRISHHTGVHFRVAFLPDRQLEYVPGSEQRWDSPAELAIRKGSNPTDGNMPGRRTVALNTGDACLFHAWGIHRGTYKMDIPRRTLDIIYGWGGVCDYSPPPPMCLRDPDLIAQLTRGAREFFEHFVRCYLLYWENAKPLLQMERRQ
jgi:Phytanoyl-CoA dioxygenase (PhyH)